MVALSPAEIAEIICRLIYRWTVTDVDATECNCWKISFLSFPISATINPNTITTCENFLIDYSHLDRQSIFNLFIFRVPQMFCVYSAAEVHGTCVSQMIGNVVRCHMIRTRTNQKHACAFRSYVCISCVDICTAIRAAL